MNIVNYLQDISGMGAQLKGDTARFRNNLYITLSKVTSLSKFEKDVYKKGNVAVVFYKINKSMTGILFAHSQINYPTDPFLKYSTINNYYATTCVLLREDKVFITKCLPSRKEPLPFDRMYDTEAKLLEELRAIFDEVEKPSGEIHLFTELYPCQSCQYVINQFKQRYNGDITVNVYFEN